MLKKLLIAVSLVIPALFPAGAQTKTPDKWTAVKVTTLADSGTGSLRDCVLKDFPRVCVFEVSGRIRLLTKLEIKKGNLIIAGQTAPSPGVVLTDSGVIVMAPNVTVEHISVRVGDNKNGPPPSQRDSVSVQTKQAVNVTLRNLSISWAIDENFSTYGPVNTVRLEDSIVSEALYKSLHPKGPHSMGALVGETARNVSFVGNLFAANNDRNVRWKFDTTGEMVGNVVYGWGGTSSWNITNLSNLDGKNLPTKIDVIGNVFLAGPNGLKAPTVIYAKKTSSDSQVYMADNIAPNLTNLPEQNIASQRVGGTTPEEQPSSQTLGAVLNSAGSRPWDRNPVDLNVIDGVLKGSLAIRDKVNEWPVIAENQRSLTPPALVMTSDQLSDWLKQFEGRSAPGKDTRAIQPEPTPIPAPTATPIPPTPTPEPTATPAVDTQNPNELIDPTPSAEIDAGSPITTTSTKPS